jgi:hypothetical protein
MKNAGSVKSPSVRLRRRAFYFAILFLTLYEIIKNGELIKEPGEFFILYFYP